jgi:hypothetical protein
LLFECSDNFFFQLLSHSDLTFLERGPCSSVVGLPEMQIEIGEEQRCYVEECWGKAQRDTDSPEAWGMVPAQVLRADLFMAVFVGGGILQT